MVDKAVRLRSGWDSDPGHACVDNRMVCSQTPAGIPSSGQSALVIVPVASPGTLIHVSPVGDTHIDLVDINVVNTNVLSVISTVDVGGIEIPISLSTNVLANFVFPLVNGEELRAWGSIASALKMIVVVRRVRRTF